MSFWGEVGKCTSRRFVRNVDAADRDLILHLGLFNRISVGHARSWTPAIEPGRSKRSTALALNAGNQPRSPQRPPRKLFSACFALRGCFIVNARSRVQQTARTGT